MEDQEFNVNLLLNEDEKYKLISDGESTLSFIKSGDTGLGDNVFAFSLLDDGGFSSVLFVRKDWEDMKKKVDSFLDEVKS